MIDFEMQDSIDCNKFVMEMHEAEVKYQEEQKLERLRDEFAMRVDIRSACNKDGYLDDILAICVMDSKPPSWDSAPRLTVQLWWDEAESRYRYFKADQMIKSRSKS